MRWHRDHLEEMVRNRTATLTWVNRQLQLEVYERRRTEEKLRLAKEGAEAANHAKSEFLSNMSHELRSPLNAVVGFSDLLLLNPDADEVLKLVPKIKDAGDYLVRLIDDLLDFDRIEAGKARLELRKILVNELVRGVVESYRPSLPSGFSLSLALDPACGAILCDPVRINQVLESLLDNALKFSPKGEPSRCAPKTRAARSG